MQASVNGELWFRYITSKHIKEVFAVDQRPRLRLVASVLRRDPGNPDERNGEESKIASRDWNGIQGDFAGPQHEERQRLAEQCDECLSRSQMRETKEIWNDYSCSEHRHGSIGDVIDVGGLDDLVHGFRIEQIRSEIQHVSGKDDRVYVARGEQEHHQAEERGKKRQVGPSTHCKRSRKSFYGKARGFNIKSTSRLLCASSTDIYFSISRWTGGIQRHGWQRQGVLRLAKPQPHNVTLYTARQERCVPFCTASPRKHRSVLLWVTLPSCLPHAWRFWEQFEQGAHG
jgi:hypothetical protein